MATKTKKTDAEPKRKKQPAYKAVERKGNVAGVIADAMSELQSLRDECAEARDNMEEKLSATEKYQMYSDAADTLDNHADNEPDVPEFLREEEVSYFEERPTRKGRGASRAVRLSNAVAMLQSACDAAQEVVDEEGRDEDEVGEAETLVSDLEDIINEVENVEFPGMFG